MKMESRYSKSVKNIIFSFLSQLCIMLLSFILPRLLISGFGSQVNGFFSTVNQLFSYLEILRAGVGMAAIQALYKPITADDKDSISNILSSSKKYFDKLGFLYLAISILIGVFFTLSNNTGLQRHEVFLIVIMQGVSGWISFSKINWFVDLLRAEGKIYVYVIIQTIAKIFILSLEIVAVYFTHNAVLVKSVALIFTVLQFLVITVYRRRNYYDYDFSRKQNLSLLANRKSYLVFHISSMICTNTDVVVVSVFCGYKIASVYSVYYLVVSGVNAILNTVYSGTSFILGHSYQEGIDAFKRTYDVYNLLYTTLTTCLFSICYILLIPFICLYTKGISDINYIYKWLPCLFCLIQILSCGKNLGEITVNVGGLADKVVWRSILEASLNIIISLIMVQFIGIYGVLLGTVCALLYRLIDVIIFTNKHILKRSSRKCFKILIENIVLFILVVIVNEFINLNITSYLSFILWGLIFCVILFPTIFAVNLILNKDERLLIVLYLKKLFHRGQ